MREWIFALKTNLNFYKDKVKRFVKQEAWTPASAVKDRFHGQQCIILGCSPNTSQADLDLVSRHPNVIAVNAAVKAVDRCRFAVLTNVNFNKQFDASYAQSINCDFFVSHHDPTCRALFPPDKTILITYYPKVNIHAHSWNLSRILPWGPTTILDAALPLAVWCGFKEILLVGCQYPLETPYTRLNNEKSDTRPTNTEGIQREMKLAHQKWARWAAMPLRGEQIINCTPDSSIEVFPKFELAEKVKL